MQGALAAVSTDISSQLVAYHAFVKTTLSKGGSIDEEATPTAFLECQRQLNQLREELRPAIERYQRGEEALEVDIEQLFEDVLRQGSQKDEPR